MEPFTISPDLAVAATPPRELYTTADAFRLAIERAFQPGWHFAMERTEPAAPFTPATLLPGALDQPLLFTHEAGATRCFANVCTHRGARLCDAPASTRTIACPYHGRRFGLDGLMRHAPGFEGAQAFPSASDDLAPIAHGALGPALFARAEGDLGFDAWMGPLRARLGWLPFDALRFVPEASKDWALDASWALYCDNYLEGMHVPFVHPALSRALDLGAYYTELFPWGTLQIGFAREGDPAPVFDPPAGAPEHGRRVAAYWAWLFPGTMLNFYPWGLSVNVVTPVAVARTLVRYVSFAWDLSLRDVGAGGDLDQVEREDQAIVLAVQAGLASRAYGRGRYAPLHERGVHHFHRLLARAMFGA